MSLRGWERLRDVQKWKTLVQCIQNYWLSLLRGCPCKNRPLGFRPKTEFLQNFRVRQLVHMINKNGNNLAFNAIFQYFWWQFQRTVQNRLEIVLFRVKFRRCAEGAEKLFLHSNTIKLTDHFISCFAFWLSVKYLKSGSRKINCDFLKMPHKEPSQNLSGHAAVSGSFSQKYNVIRSPDQYPCLVLGLLYLEQEKKVWALAFLNYRSSINIANI